MSRGRWFKPDFPFAPARVPFFYGWVIVAVSTLGVCSSIPGQTAGVGPFTEALMAHLELTRLELSIAFMVGTVGGGLMMPKMGAYFDRYGARVMGLLSQVAFGGALFYMALCDRLYHVLRPDGGRVMWLAFGLVALGFFMIRFLGQGVVTLVGRALVGKWFNRKRGLASAIGGSFAAVFFASSPLLLFELTQAIGWRQAWVACGAFMLLVMALLCWLFYRDNPEECGLEMDGEPLPAPAEGPGDPEFVVHREFTGAEALKTYAFWVYTSVFCLNGVFATAFSFHAVDIAREAGLEAAAFFRLFLVMTIFNIPTGFFIGWLTGRTKLKYSLGIMAASMGVSSAGLILMPSPLGLGMFVVGGGISWGCFGTLMAVVYPRYFGRRHLGKISGWSMMALVLSSAVAPLLWSLSQGLTGAYAPANWALAGACGLMLLLSVRADNPQRRLAPPRGLAE